MKRIAIAGVLVLVALLSLAGVAKASGIIEILTHNYYWTDGTFNGWPQVTSGWSMHVVTGGNNFAQFKNTNTTGGPQGDLLCSDIYNLGTGATTVTLNSDFNDLSADSSQGFIQYGIDWYNSTGGLVLQEDRLITYSTVEGWVHLNSINDPIPSGATKVGVCYWVRTNANSTVKFRVRLPDAAKFVP